MTGALLWSGLTSPQSLCEHDPTSTLTPTNWDATRHYLSALHILETLHILLTDPTIPLWRAADSSAHHTPLLGCLFHFAYLEGVTFMPTRAFIVADGSRPAAQHKAGAFLEGHISLNSFLHTFHGS